MRDDNATELPTTYASKLVDLDPDAGPEKLPTYYQITFLGIFAVPALIDILLLTTIGRGLYLTAFMSEDEKHMATTALMLALLLCGAIGTWIGSGGSYYLHSMAFPAMNMFVLTRFIAGIAVCLASGAVALIIIALVKGAYAGIIFLLYFVILTTYFSMLAALAIYQLPGFMFQSGRMVILSCIPILFISPLLTPWIGHDVLVYLCVLGSFLTALLFGARSVISQWGSWYLKITCTSDNDVLQWYIKTASSKPALQGTADIAAASRQALRQAVLRERNRRIWTKPTGDELVRKLSAEHLATNLLMTWYCKYTKTKMPLAYSPTWNLQCNAGLDTLREMQKGLKLHNAFVHWRHAGDEVYCGILYFVIALMDKWVALISGGSIVGLSAANSATYRLAVGFSLASYLISAVFLDGIASPLWATANKKMPRPVRSLQYLRQVASADAKARRRLYWTTLCKFFFMHFYGVAITACLMWTFEESRSAVYMYLAYMAAYAGLLWYQFNRIFTGTRALNDLLIAAALGLLIGPLLRHFLPQFDFSSVIALAVSTWTVAMLSIYTANVWWPRFKDDKRDNNKTETPIFHCSSTLEHHQQHSQSALSEIYQSISAMDPESRYRINPSEYPGVQIIQQLKDDGIEHRSKLVRDAFPSARHLLRRTAELFENGEVIVDLVLARHLYPINAKMRSISRNACGRLHVFLLIDHGLKMDIYRLSKFAAAALVQATTEVRLGLSHDHSTLAEVLASNDNEREELLLPEGVKCQLETSASERAKVLKNRNKALLHYLLLGLDCDTDWDRLPETARCFLLRRCCGEPCYLSGSQLEWVRKDRALDIEQYMARCNLGVNYTDLVTSFAEALESDNIQRDSPELSDYLYTYSAETAVLSCEKFLDTPASSGSGGPLSWSTLMRVTSPNLFFARIYHALRVCTKFLAVSLVADPEFQRELDYLMSFQPRFVRWPVKCVLNGIWIFCKTLQQLILPIFLFHGREEVSKLYNNMKGIKTVMKKDKIMIESLSGPSTCFLQEQPDGGSQLHQYSGSLTQEPSNSETLMAINTYTERLVLRQRQEFAMKKMVGLFTYEYTDQPHTRLPIQRQCIKGDLSKRVVQYDSRGYVTSGSYVEDGNLVEFKWSYRKNAKFDDELLRAEYVLAHIRIEVSWCVPPPKNAEKLDRWLPNSKVMEATYIQDSEVYRSKWSYDHRSHPVIETTLNDQPVATPPMIQYDWFHVLTKPKQCSFLRENPLVSFSSGRTSFLSRMLGFTTHRHRISTSSARTHLWKSWKNSTTLDAVTARWLDDHALRSDRILRPYWRARDTGRLKAAKSYLDAQADTLMGRTDIDPEVSSWTLLAYKISDFYSFGQGGDATINTRTQSTQMRDSHDTLHVLAHDTGTWPNEGGGVSACRRDMVNDLRSIRWHVLAENANDFGLPKFQIEKNVQSLTVLPLWGLDFLTPTHGIFENHLDSAVQQRSHNSTPADIRKNFFPILGTLVRCSRAIHLRKDHLEDAAKALVDLNAYFQSSRHWSDVWMSDTVKEQWQELWLTEDADNQRPISEWLLAEHPTLSHLDQALDMWHRYLFIFSIPVPEKIPDVFQASHHFAGASYGVLCKLLRKCTLHVWDHCISWREVTVFLSSAMSFDPPFVCTSLMGLSRLTTSLILTHADVVLPCADFFNPGWEVELGTIGGTLGHRRTFARKIDPVINGIADMERFNPIEKIKSEKPTVSMLSHVRFVKDIKNAILAADIIVNEWGFEDYRLEIYGDMIRAPSYSVECQEIVAAKSLGKYVLLKGLGSPAKVLERAWIFLNCSVSEGLPLAMGEASLTGVPVVCTDVGASFRVVTDPETGKRFSAVVAPNDSLSLAKAQINVLALLDEWSQFAGDEDGYHPKLPFRPTREDAKQITKRMYEKNEQRRALGMMGRANVLNSFSSDRYLREHEQMLWIGKYRSRSYNDRMSQSTSYNSSRLALNEMRVTVPHSESSRQSLFTETSSPAWQQLCPTTAVSTHTEI
jgi:glycosyltransferase involved in cell wall biosynthesis